MLFKMFVDMALIDLTLLIFPIDLMERMRSLREKEKMAKVRNVGSFPACTFQLNAEKMVTSPKHFLIFLTISIVCV